ESFHGYAEYVVTVTNHSKTATYRVQLTLPRDKHGQAGNSLRTVTRQVEVGPKATVRAALLQPHLPMYGNGLQVAIDGVRQEQSLPLNIGHGNRGGRFTGKHMDGHPVVLVGRGVHQALLDRARNPAFGGAAEPVDPRGGVAPWLEVHWVRS